MGQMSVKLFISSSPQLTFPWYQQLSSGNKCQGQMFHVRVPKLKLDLESHKSCGVSMYSVINCISSFHFIFFPVFILPQILADWG